MRQVLVTMVLVHTTGLVNPYSAPPPYFMPRKLKKVAFKQRDAFRGAFYKLVCGTAIGSPVTANMVMEDIEERALASFPISPQFWNWYVDDMCCVVPSDQIVQLLPHLSSIGSFIQFIYETGWWPRSTIFGCTLLSFGRSTAGLCPHTTLWQLLVHPKVCIEQSGRSLLGTRLKEHKAAVKFVKTDVCAVSKHVWQKHHQMDFQSTTILARDKDVGCKSPGSCNNNTTVLTGKLKFVLNPCFIILGGYRFLTIVFNVSFFVNTS